MDGDDTFQQGCLLHVLPPATRRNAQCCGASRDPLPLQSPYDGCSRGVCGSLGLSVFVSLTCGRSSQQARRTARPLPIVTQILSRDSAEQFVVEYPAQPGAFTYSSHGAMLCACSSTGPAATYTRPAGRFLVCDDGRDPGQRVNLNKSSHFDARCCTRSGLPRLSESYSFIITSYLATPMTVLHRRARTRPSGPFRSRGAPHNRPRLDSMKDQIALAEEGLL